MKKLLILTALVEVPTGLALLIVPAIVVKLLLGAEISGAGIPLGRVAGIALLALGVACWSARGDTQNCAARGLVAAMLVYNFGAVTVFLMAAFGAKEIGIALWPAIILHTAMGVWCGANFLSKSAQK